MIVKVIFDKKKNNGYYFQEVKIPKNVSLKCFDYDGIPNDVDEKGKPCKVTIWRSGQKSKYNIEVSVKKKEIFKTKIPLEVEFKIDYVS